jgi:hypothetical protein
MPMILGDETVWCVYNDGVFRFFKKMGSTPKDIEMHNNFTSKKLV